MYGDFGFEPATVTIQPGTAVIWTNEGPTIHNTVSKERGIWELPIMAKGDEYRFTFETAGEFPYWCTLHPTMLGTVTVVEG
jgi:plastocyanin